MIIKVTFLFVDNLEFLQQNYTIAKPFEQGYGCIKSGNFLHGKINYCFK